MSNREIEILKKIEETRVQLQSLVVQIEVKRAYLKGLEEFYENSFNRSALKNASGNKIGLDSPINLGRTLKAGTEIFRVKEIIKKAGHPLHVSDIMKQLGSIDKKKKVSLTGSLNQYATKGRIFVKTAPNTYGILEGA